MSTIVTTWVLVILTPFVPGIHNINNIMMVHSGFANKTECLQMSNHVLQQLAPSDKRYPLNVKGYCYQQSIYIER